MNCLICNSPKVFAKKHKKYKNFQRCSECGLIFVYPQPTNHELEKIYNADYFKNSDSHFCGYENYEGDRNLIVKSFLDRLRLIEKYAPKAKNSGVRRRLLDVGCAMGFMMEA